MVRHGVPTRSLLAMTAALGATVVLMGAPRSSTPDDARRLVAEARQALEEDRYEDALDLSGSAVEIAPDLAPAHVVKADALYRRGDFNEAERHYRAAVELDEESASAHFGVGRILRTLGRYSEAASSFSRAAALSPHTPRYLRILANHLARRDDSLALLRRYLALVGPDPPAEEKEIAGNVRAWVALLDKVGDAPLSELVRADPCEVRLDVRKGQPYLRLAVNGVKNQRFVFDTGATGLTVSPRLARRARLEPIRPFTIAGTGAGRTERGDLVVLSEIVLCEGIVLRNVPATIREPAGPEEGLIGPSLFSAFDLTIDLKRRRLSLESPGEQRPGRVEPFRNVGGEIFITAEVNGIPFNAMVDTGSAATLVGRTTVGRVPGLAAMPGQWFAGTTLGVGGPLGDRKVIVSGALQFAGRDYPADGLLSGDLSGISRSLESEVYVILGVPHLDDSAFTIDYRRMTVTFARP